MPIYPPDLPLWLALAFAPNIGPVQFSRIREHFPDLKALFALSVQDLLECGIPKEAISAILQPNTALIDKHLSWMQQDQHYILTLEDKFYPSTLKQIYAPPPILYVRGCLDALHQPQIAMVGSRNPTRAGRESAYHFSRELVKHGFTVTSGLALGIDAASHEGAMDGEGGCIAVMGTGLDKIYPARHNSLAHAILKTGAWVSEFPLGTTIKPENFPRRNRLISGLSKGVFVVEAALQSGSLITARYALEQGREVYAMPGSIHNPLAKGCHYLLKQGAKLVETITDLIDEIQVKSNTYVEKPVNKSEQVLDESLISLLECIDFAPNSFDEILLRSGLPAEKVAQSLFRLELGGYIYQEGGGYARTVNNNV